MMLTGFDRGERGVGVRDHVVVLPSVGCTNRTVETLGRHRPDVRVLTHQHGCGQLGDDLSLTTDLLAGVCANPNVRGAVVVGLGCESNQPRILSEGARERGARAEVVVLQEAGGLEATVTRALEQVDAILAEPVGTVEIGPEDLTVALVSDEASGAAGRTVLTAVAEHLRATGGRVLEGDTASTAELRGGATRVPEAWTPRMRRRLPLADPVDTANPIERLSAMAADGAQVAVFATGRGDPSGCPTVPTLKVGTDPDLAGLLEGIVDVDADPADPDRSARRIVEALLEVAGGRQAAAESAGQRDFGIPRIAPTM